MNRNGATILTMAVLLSMLASPTARFTPSDTRGAAGTGTAVVQSRGSKPTRASNTTTQHMAHATKDAKEAGAADYQDQITDFLQQYCADGNVASAKARCPADNFVIALVPDPVHTHLALSFDRITDTIQEALQDDGYIFDRPLIPWDTETHPQPDDYKLRLEAKHYQEGKEQFPGVLLFRPSADVDAPKDPLVVLLVAETPTGGIQEEQFENAIRQITETKKRNELKLRILGPSFSGSLASLKKLLTCGKNPCFKSATILSGTISSRESVDAFRKQETLVNATFDTFQETDVILLERFVEFVSGESYGKRGYHVRNIAELSEDETAYGHLQPDKPKPTQPSQPSKPTQPIQPPDLLRLYFPREISQLRAAYQDSSAPLNSDKNLPLQGLPHNFGITGADDDTVASFSQKQTPLSQEAVLLSIVAELRKHAIEFVVLRATDPLDLLFLSHYLRTAYPQGRIVTINADVLFPREVEDTSLHGILALSTYSVSPSANHQFFQLAQSGAERMFPSSSEIGTYNALHSLMTAEVSPVPYNCRPEITDNGCTDELWSIVKEKQPPQEKVEKPLYLIQYGWRERGEFDQYNAPPVRLTALGHDGYWPIANLGPFPGENNFTLLPQVVSNPQGRNPCVPVKQFVDEPPPVDEQPPELQVPNSWVVMEVVGLALAFGFCVSLWFGSVASPWQQLAQFAPTMARARGRLIAAAGTFLIFLLMILLWPFVHGRGDWKMTNASLSAVSLIVGMSAVFLVTLFDISQRGGLFAAVTQRKTATRPYPPNLTAIAAFVAASVVLAYFAFFRPEHHPERLAGVRHFETLRAIQLTSGLSPILPILFLLGAGLWWANHTASGWILLDRRRPRLPARLQKLRLAIGEDAVSVRALLNNLRPGPSSGAHYIALLGIILGAWFVVGTLRPVRTIEHARYDRYQLLPFLVTAWAGLIGTTLRLWNIWFSARQLLLALDSSPLRRGFQRLEGFSWKPIWKFGDGALGEYRRILAREREAIERAFNTVPELKNPKLKIDRRLHQTERWYRKLRSYRRPFSLHWLRRRKVEQKLIGSFSSFQRAVAVAAGDALTYLADRWQHETEEPIRRRGPETPEELKVRACERFVSLVYVSFLLVVLARMRTLIVAIGGMYILILLGMTLYPFEPRPSTQAFLAASLVFIVTVVGLVFAQIHRDATLSYITDTKPGELGVDFWLRMASFIALPLFSLFASQFPEVGRFFYGWLQPALQALNR
jgi:hypothetical protein